MRLRIRESLTLVVILFLILIAGYFLGQDRLRAITAWSLLVRESLQYVKAAGSDTYLDFTFQELAGRGIDFVLRTVPPFPPSWYGHASGVCAADIDTDGFHDLFFANQLGGSQMWRNTGSGAFENVTMRARTELPDTLAIGCAFADMDNDGDQDLFVATIRSGNKLLQNDGTGVFIDITGRAGLRYDGHSSAPTFFDYDSDGLLDILVVNFGKFTTDTMDEAGTYFIPQDEAVMLGADANSAESSILYRNLGNGRFEDVTERAGLDSKGWYGDASFRYVPSRKCPDLAILNMFGVSHYYENKNCRSFEDKTAAVLGATPQGAMGLKFFDFNADGALDLFITDMHSDMAYDQTYAEETKKTDGSRFAAGQSGTHFMSLDQGAILGNALYVSAESGFEEVSDKIRAETYWPWGLSVADFNADGYEDAFLSSGMGGTYRYGTNSLLINEGGKRFIESNFVLGIEPRKNLYQKDMRMRLSESSRSSVAFDIENDGDIDIITTELYSRAKIFSSNLSEKKHVNYLKIELRGTRSNRDGLGALVSVEADGKTMIRSNDGKSGYLSQSQLPLYFGLGDSESVESIRVRWPSGIEQEIDGHSVSINATLEIKEP